MPGFTLTPVACGLRPGATCPNGRFSLYAFFEPAPPKGTRQKKPGGTLLRRPGTLTATGGLALAVSSLERLLRDDAFPAATG